MQALLDKKLLTYNYSSRMNSTVSSHWVKKKVAKCSKGMQMRN